MNAVFAGRSPSCCSRKPLTKVVIGGFHLWRCRHLTLNSGNHVEVVGMDHPRMRHGSLARMNRLRHRNEGLLPVSARQVRHLSARTEGGQDLTVVHVERNHQRVPARATADARKLTHKGDVAGSGTGRCVGRGLVVFLMDRPLGQSAYPERDLRHRYVVREVCRHYWRRRIPRHKPVFRCHARLLSVP